MTTIFSTSQWANSPMWTSNDSATLWPVNDVAARRFALRFYAYRKRGKPKAAAYQEAVHDLLRGKFNT